MAIHIQMSEEAEALLRKEALKNKLSSVLACLLFMGMGFGILYFTAVFIVGDTPVSFLAYTPPAEDGPPTNNPQPRELTSRSQPASTSVAPSVIVTTSAASVTMAPVEIDMSDGLSLDSALDIGLGDTDLGEGLGSGGSGLGSGQGGGSALEGTFYDLKQTGKGRARRLSKLAKKKPDGMIEYDKHAFYQVIADFVNKGWNKGVLGRYFESEQKLYASNFFLPVAKARYAPIAYQLGDPKKPETQWVCQSGAWAVVYRGRVRAPKTGKFRFIGMGDDYIAVRFNRQLVLSAGYRMFTHYDPKAKGGPKFWFSNGADNRNAFFKDVKSGADRVHKGYELVPNVAITQLSDGEPEESGSNVWKDELGGLMAGKEFKVTEGEIYDIEILITEEGGGFGFVLCIEDITNGKNAKAKQYDLFRTNFSAPSAKEINALLQESDCIHTFWKTNKKIQLDVPYNEDSLIWTAVP